MSALNEKVRERDISGDFTLVLLDERVVPIQIPIQMYEQPNNRLSAGNIHPLLNISRPNT